jgi:putative membrane protein
LHDTPYPWPAARAAVGQHPFDWGFVMLERKLRYLSAVCVASAALGLAACNNDSDRDRDSDRQSRDRNQQDMETNEAMRPPAIAGTLQAINNGEIEAGRLARDRAQNAEVRRFAEMMVNQHNENNRRVREALTRDNIEPREGAVARQVSDNAQRDLQQLRDARGAEFDRVYINQQVRMHEDALRLIDNRLIPSARDTQLRTLLQDTRQHVSDHLDRAREIQRNLRNDQPGSGDDRMR